MHTITKLIGNNWLSFNPTNKLFSFDILHEDVTGYLMDLKDSADFAEFVTLYNFILGSTQTYELDNTTSTLTFFNNGSSVSLFYSTEEEDKGKLIDTLTCDEVEELCDLLLYITLLVKDYADE